MENQINTASQIEELTNKAQLLGLFPGPQQYFVQFLTANSGVVGSLADLVQKIENGTATRNDYIDVAKDFVNIGTATVGMVNPGARVVLGGIGIATNILDYADSRNYDMSIIYNETLGSMINYVKHNDIDNMVDDINKLYEKTINSITNVKSSVINNSNVYDFDYSANFLHTNNFLSDTYYTNISKIVSNYLISSDPTSNYANMVNSGLLNPINIGAFYESTTNKIDNSTSIANKTYVLLNSSNQSISKSQLESLDLNKDGKLNGSEILNLKTWKDLNEDGIAQSNEITSLNETIYSKDYDTYTIGNSKFQNQTTITTPIKQSVSYTTPTSNYSSLVKSVIAPAIPNSNFDTLRNSDNVYYLSNGRIIGWSASQVKINNSNRTYMIGTNGNDSFDYRYYQATGYFDVNILRNFLGGAGDDQVGGSNYADNIWGGIGSDTLYGYDGDDNVYGEDGNDILLGQNGNDKLFGGAGNDLMYGHTGTDTLYGGIGNDELHGNEGNDTLVGEAGDDLVFGEVGDDTIYGDDGNDRLIGFTASNDTKQTLLAGETDNDLIFGGNGNDMISGLLGNDRLYGESGIDTIYGGDGNDYIDGGLDNDILLGENGDDTIFSGTGDDELQGGYGNDILSGDIGNDKIFGQTGNDTIYAGEGNDILVGFTASNESKQTLFAGETDNDLIYGGNGNDMIYGKFGSDRLFGEAGNDFIAGGLDNDYMDGGINDDELLGEEGNDTIFGGDGNDELQGGDGIDLLLGETGNDKIFGQVGNDTIWGGDGNDILVGFTASNEIKQTLLTGETDDDLIYAGNGNDLVIGGLGSDTLFGEAGDDEIQAGDGNDMLYGGEGYDRLFGQSGNDIIYGGAGDDLIVGFKAANETQTLAVGESDNDFLYGGDGKDTILGGLGNDYIDGGAGADEMEGGAGNDFYIVNSINDSILEFENDGYDTVLSSTNYLLNKNIEELRLVDGYNINATGNSLDNKLIGNSSDNIIDGVTGKDTMIGGLGNDIYYVDNIGDQVIENTNEGKDTVYTTIDYTLGNNVENLLLLDFSKAERGIVDGQNTLVYGYPKMYELDYMQGDAVPDFQGTCALTSIANLLTQNKTPTTESQVVNVAINNNWAVTNPSAPSYMRGGSNYLDQQNILNSFGISNGLLQGYNPNAIANLIQSGRGVILALNAGYLWDEPSYVGNGAVNHVVTVTGVAYKESDSSLMGFYIADSGRGKVSDMTRYVSLDKFNQVANVSSAYSIYTNEPIKLWDENTNGYGNDADNVIVGNRGANELYGYAGNDTIEAGRDNDKIYGGSGNDTYMFNLGDGNDTLFDESGVDKIHFNSSVNKSDILFSYKDNDLEINYGNEKITIQNQKNSLNSIEKVELSNGNYLSNSDIDSLIQQISAFGQENGIDISNSQDVKQNTQLMTIITNSWKVA